MSRFAPSEWWSELLTSWRSGCLGAAVIGLSSAQSTFFSFSPLLQHPIFSVNYVSIICYHSNDKQPLLWVMATERTFIDDIKRCLTLMTPQRNASISCFLLFFFHLGRARCSILLIYFASAQRGDWRQANGTFMPQLVQFLTPLVPVLRNEQP